MKRLNFPLSLKVSFFMFLSLHCWSSPRQMNCESAAISKTLPRFNGELVLSVDADSQVIGTFRGELLPAGSESGQNATSLYWQLNGTFRLYQPGELTGEATGSYELIPLGTVNRPAYIKVLANSQKIGLTSRLLLDQREYQAYCY